MDCIFALFSFQISPLGIAVFGAVQGLNAVEPADIDLWSKFSKLRNQHSQCLAISNHFESTDFNCGKEKRFFEQQIKEQSQKSTKCVFLGYLKRDSWHNQEDKYIYTQGSPYGTDLRFFFVEDRP